MEFSSTDVFGYQLLHTMYINIIVRMNAKIPTSDHNFDETVNVSFGSTPEVRPGLCECLLSGVKESVSTCNFILGDSLQGARSGRLTSKKP